MKKVKLDTVSKLIKAGLSMEQIAQMLELELGEVQTTIK